MIPVDLTEGQEVKITILPDEDPVLTALGDLVVSYSPITPPEIDQEALQHEIDQACQSIPPVSEAIIEERHS